MCNSWIQFHLWSLTEKWQIKQHHEAHRQPNFLKHGRCVNPCQGFAKVYILFFYKYDRYLLVDFKPFSLICQMLGCGILKYILTVKSRAVHRLSRLVAQIRIFRSLMKGKFDAYVLWPLAKKFQNWIVNRSTARDFTVFEIVDYALALPPIFCQTVNPISTNGAWPIYECHVTTPSRNRVKSIIQ